MPCGEETRDKSAERVADEHVRRSDICAFEQDSKLTGLARGTARHRPGVAPAEAGAIVGAGAGMMATYKASRGEGLVVEDEQR